MRKPKRFCPNMHTIFREISANSGISANSRREMRHFPYEID